jgi:hypothetical protein
MPVQSRSFALLRAYMGDRALVRAHPRTANREAGIDQGGHRWARGNPSGSH